jgi:thioredoxin reductase
LSSAETDVAVVGAGPYGLSLAAHLSCASVPHRVFGVPMESWMAHMPDGMYLKSEGFASNIGHPRGRFTLREYCREAGRPYGDYGRPVAIETFRAYGSWFQRRAVPDLEALKAVSVQRAGTSFELGLANGESVRARVVVIASGLTHCRYIPAELGALAPDAVSHTYDHSDFDRFAGRDVTVIGRGQSALESAALLRERGAVARILVRGSTVSWNPPPWSGPRPLRWRIRAPRAGLGDGWRLWFFSNMTDTFARLPYRRRIRLARETLGPAGAWWLRGRVEPHVPVMLAHQLTSAHARDGMVRVRVTRASGEESVIETGHVLAATGYRVDLDRLPFLGRDLRSELATRDGVPILSPTLESSAPGLHFIGLAAAGTLGPVMRFVCGSGAAARAVLRGVQRA